MSTLKVGEIKHENFTGTTQLKLDNSGRLLLGTTTEGVGGADNFTIAGSGDSGMTIRSGTSSTGGLYFSDGTSGADEYRGVISYNQASNYMRFYTDASERMRIDSSGGLLFNGNGVISVQSNSSSLFLGGGSVQPSETYLESGTLTGFKVNGSERLRIDSSGNVMIGTTTKGQLNADNFTIDGGDAETGITIRSGTSRGNHIYFADGTSGADEYRGIISYQHSDNRMQFYTDATERLRITTSGIFPVADGQTFNSSQLPNGNSFQINTTSSNHGLSVTRYSTNYAGYALNIGRSKSNTIGTNSLVGSGDDLGHITWYGADGTDFNQAAAISALVDGTASGGEDMPGALAFKTTSDGSGYPQARMWIASNGRVAIGDSLGTAAAGKFQVVEESGSDASNDCNAYFETNAGDWNIKTYYNKAGTHYHLVFVEQGTERGNVSGSDGSNVTFNQGSDYRWKENVVRMTGDEGIEICKKLKPSKYNWIENRETTGQINTVDGFIAHEVVEAGVLGAVTGEKDAVKEDGSIDGQMLDYGQLTPVLAAGIKGLIAKIETLETKVAALEAA